MYVQTTDNRGVNLSQCEEVRLQGPTAEGHYRVIARSWDEAGQERPNYPLSDPLPEPDALAAIYGIIQRIAGTAWYRLPGVAVRFINLAQFLEIGLSGAGGNTSVVATGYFDARGTRTETLVPAGARAVAITQLEQIVRLLGAR